MYFFGNDWYWFLAYFMTNIINLLIFQETCLKKYIYGETDASLSAFHNSECGSIIIGNIYHKL